MIIYKSNWKKLKIKTNPKKTRPKATEARNQNPQAITALITMFLKSSMPKLYNERQVMKFENDHLSYSRNFSSKSFL